MKNGQLIIKECCLMKSEFLLQMAGSEQHKILLQIRLVSTVRAADAGVMMCRIDTLGTVYTN